MTILYNCKHSGDQIPLSPSELDLIERLEAKTVILDCGCWHWNGSKVEDEYGVISYLGQQHRINRLIYLIYKGPLIPGLLICHSCDHPPCWNPDHLWQGTHADNTQDMWNKGREGKFKRGRKHGESSKLNEREVFEIRKHLQENKLTQREIGALYMVSDVMVSNIKTGKAWSWL